MEIIINPSKTTSQVFRINSPKFEVAYNKDKALYFELNENENLTTVLEKIEAFYGVPVDKQSLKASNNLEFLQVLWPATTIPSLNKLKRILANCNFSMDLIILNDKMKQNNRIQKKLKITGFKIESFNSAYVMLSWNNCLVIENEHLYIIEYKICNNNKDSQWINVNETYSTLFSGSMVVRLKIRNLQTDLSYMFRITLHSEAGQTNHEWIYSPKIDIISPIVCSQEPKITVTNVDHQKQRTRKIETIDSSNKHMKYSKKQEINDSNDFTIDYLTPDNNKMSTNKNNYRLNNEIELQTIQNESMVNQIIKTQTKNQIEIDFETKIKPQIGIDSQVEVEEITNANGRIEVSKETIKPLKLCVRCDINPRNVILLGTKEKPCGHIRYCNDCYTRNTHLQKKCCVCFVPTIKTKLIQNDQTQQICNFCDTKRINCIIMNCECSYYCMDCMKDFKQCPQHSTPIDYCIETENIND